MLLQLYLADQSGANVGRESLLKAAKESGLSCSQQEIRRILQSLDQQGLVHVTRGRGGTGLTSNGRLLAQKLSHTSE